MLAETDAGIFIYPPQTLIDESLRFPVARDGTELQAEFAQTSHRDR
jgi:hypothetical protein